jgi:uroporphyrinogen-III synthase
MTGSLAGKRIVVPESRQLDLFARMLEERGAVTLRCPMVTILDLDDPAPAVAWLQRLVSGKFDDLILLTGEGLRRLMGVAASAGIADQAAAALGKLRTVTRGPKPVRALREIGLEPGLLPGQPTTEGVIAILKAENLSGHRVGVQLVPGSPNDKLLDFLNQAGAVADPVTPYRYASDAETARVVAAIEEMAAGKVDAIAFTSSPQVQRLAEVARENKLERELKEGLARTRVASVGPVVTAAIEAFGARVSIAPPGDAFHMKPLVNAISAAFEL